MRRVRATARRTFRSLSVRNYRLYFFGQGVSLSGTWMQSVGQAWLVLKLSGGGLALGIVTSLQFLPMLLIRIGWWAFCWMRRTYPQVQKKYGGTVGVTAVGMFGKGAGWGIPINDHTLDVTLGGVASKPGVIDGQIAIREYLCMTLSFDHAIIDGAPAARFTERLKDLIESGYGLCESSHVPH